MSEYKFRKPKNTVRTPKAESAYITARIVLKIIPTHYYVC